MDLQLPSIWSRVSSGRKAEKQAIRDLRQGTDSLIPEIPNSELKSPLQITTDAASEVKAKGDDPPRDTDFMNPDSAGVYHSPRPDSEYMTKAEVHHLLFDQSFMIKCEAAAKSCRQASRRYFTLAMVVRFFAASMAACTGLIGGLASWQVGIAVGGTSAMLVISDLIFGWTLSSEKYAHLAQNLIRLKNRKDPGRNAQYEELILMARSSLAESDLG